MRRRVSIRKRWSLGREGETHEAVSTDESGGVTQDGARDGVARSESGSGSGRLRLLAHQARVELEILDVLVEVLRRVGDLRARVPFVERLVLLETEHLAEPVGQKRGVAVSTAALAKVTATEGGKKENVLVERSAAPLGAGGVHPDAVDDAHDFGNAYCRKWKGMEASLVRLLSGPARTVLRPGLTARLEGSRNPLGRVRERLEDVLVAVEWGSRY